MLTLTWNNVVWIRITTSLHELVRISGSSRVSVFESPVYRVHSEHPYESPVIEFESHERFWNAATRNWPHELTWTYTQTHTHTTTYIHVCTTLYIIHTNTYIHIYIYIHTLPIYLNTLTHTLYPTHACILTHTNTHYHIHALIHKIIYNTQHTHTLHACPSNHNTPTTKFIK